VISDTPGSGGGIALRTPHGAVVEVNDTAITISNGEGASIIMKGPTISFNEGAMTIP
jgi:hypothetical protein